MRLQVKITTIQTLSHKHKDTLVYYSDKAGEKSSGEQKYKLTNELETTYAVSSCTLFIR